MENPLTALDPTTLRERRSVKWRRYDPRVLPMWVAEMDTPLAEPIRRVLGDAVARGDTGYAHLDGLGAAYRSFARDRLGWQPEVSQMMLVPDVMQGIVATLRAVTEPGAAIVVNTPAYPPFFSFVAAAGRRVVECPLGPGLRIDLDALQREFAAGVAAYLLCNPHNPTGVVATRQELLAVAELADRYAVRVLVDEIHAPLTYPGASFTPFGTLDAPAAARALVFVSASKAWNLPGLKAALLIAGPAAAGDLAALPPETSFGAGLLGVLAGQVAFTEGREWLDALLAGLQANRRLLAELLAEHLPEVVYQVPQATYLAWLDCRLLRLGDDPAEVFLRHGEVAVTPGFTFGAPGTGFVRLNFATHPDVLAEGVRRMAVAVGR